MIRDASLSTRRLLTSPSCSSRAGAAPCRLSPLAVCICLTSCSATRNRRLCPLYVKLGDQVARMRRPHAATTAVPLPLVPARDAAADEQTIAAVLAQGDCSAHFCSNCCLLLTESAAAAHRSHDVLPIRNIFTPSRSLPNIAVDDGSAQCVCNRHPRSIVVTLCACTSFTWMLLTICCALSIVSEPHPLYAWVALLFMKRLSTMAPTAYSNFPAFFLLSMPHVVAASPDTFGPGRPFWRLFSPFVSSVQHDNGYGHAALPGRCNTEASAAMRPHHSGPSIFCTFAGAGCHPVSHTAAQHQSQAHAAVSLLRTEECRSSPTAAPHAGLPSEVLQPQKLQG